jgi:hypothetical protein
VVLLLLFSANAVHLTYHREAYNPAEGPSGAPARDVRPYRKSHGLSAVITLRVGQPTTGKLLGMRVIQGPFGKDFKALLPNGPRFLQSEDLLDTRGHR